MAEIKRKILVAEDEKPLSKALVLKLQKSDFDVTVAENGEEALKALEGQKFDAILLDLMMPKMDGFEVLRQLKERGNKTPIIVSSNLSQKEDFKKAMDLGATDYFIKSETAIADVVERIKMRFGNKS